MKTYVRRLAVLAVALSSGLALFELVFLFSGQDGREVLREQGVWAHHQDTDGELRESLEQGYRGVEVDLWFSGGRFLIGHDQPETKPDLSIDRYLPLLAEHGTALWMDLKNLSLENTEAVANALQELNAKTPFLSRAFVESENGPAIAKLSRLGMPSVFWIDPHPESRLFLLRNLVNQWLILTNPIIGVSMPHEKFDGKVRWLYGGKNILLFTVNDRESISAYLSNENVRVVLTDVGK